MLSEASSIANKDGIASYIHGENFSDGQDAATGAVLDASVISVHHNLQGRERWKVMDCESM